jgi:hypothetical protein
MKSIKRHSSKDPAKETFDYLIPITGLLIVASHALYSGMLDQWVGGYMEKITNYLSPKAVIVLKMLFVIFMLLYLKADPFVLKYNIIKRIEKKSRNFHIRQLLTYALCAVLALVAPLNSPPSMFIVLSALFLMYLLKEAPLSLAYLYPESKKKVLTAFNAVLKGGTGQEDGYESLKQRENRINASVIGHNNAKVFFEHKFHRSIQVAYNGNPRRGNIIIGSSGSGKSDSILNPMGWQTMEQNVPMFGYDFKGPVQTRVMLKKYLMLRKQGKTNLFFNYNTFSQEALHIIWRMNPICSKTIVTDYHADVYMRTFMSCLKKKWIRDPDFWADSMFAYGSAVILAHKRYLPKFTFAHIIHFLSLDYEKQIHALINLEDDQINSKIENVRKPIVEGKAADQLSGIFSTIQNFMSALHNAPLFFAISGDESTLDLNNPNNPGHLWVGNDNFYRKAFQPLISMYASIIMNMTNKENKLPFHFMADEAATLFLPGIEDYINTGRSNGMMTTLAIQSLAQNVFEYGTELARVIQGSLSNVIFGQVNDLQTQEAFSKMLGTYKMVLQNPSMGLGNKNMNIQTTQSVEHYLRVDEIPTLPQGYFAGKFAEGENMKFMGPIDIGDYLDDFNSAKYLKMPLGPTVNNLFRDGDISEDLIHKYYKNDEKAEIRINQQCQKFAQSEYQRIISESNMFVTNKSVAEEEL